MNNITVQVLESSDHENPSWLPLQKETNTKQDSS